MTVSELHVEGAATLDVREGLPDPQREARWLLARVLRRDEAWVLAHPEEQVPDSFADVYRGWVARRAAGEPAHYIVGSCPFWGRVFTVTPAVLIPRPETELVVECALKLPCPANPRVLDVGTGSGCLAVTLALDLQRAAVSGTDLSLPAVEVARGNARRLGADAHFSVGNLADHLRGPFDLVVANLPYVPEGDIPGLPLEIRAFEPHLALAAGEHGTDVLTPFIADLPRLLSPEGHVLIEIGASQRARLKRAIAAAGLREVQHGLDHAGVERVLVLRRS